jgi:tRNA-specific 2-thiouridylase
MKPKAILLLSGGLDSSLALYLMAKQGIELTVLHFTTLFCTCDKKGAGCGASAYAVTKQLGIPLKIIDMTAEYLPVIRKPKHGYGSGMNPCVDCRILMFSKAKKVMEEIGALFIITGEVLSQRPMSQMRHTLDLIERESGLQGKIIRPLSAQHFPPTDAEKQGIINRQQLLDFYGRSRKPQIALAEQLGLTEYPCAAGGCLLRDLFNHNIDNINDIRLLRHGRHFRLSPGIKLIVGRNEADNDQIERLAQPSDSQLDVLNTGSPVCLFRVYNESHAGLNGYIELAASICARYSDLKHEDKVKVAYRKSKTESDDSQVISVEPIAEPSLSKFRL